MMMRVVLAAIVLLCSCATQAKPSCHGKMLNPVTQICWKCMFPLTIGGMKVFSGADDASTPPSSRSVLCTCGDPIPRVGIPVGYWEPFRVADVTTSPYCMVNLGGMSMDLGMSPPDGMVANKRGGKYGQKEALYHVHWYVYPLMAWMNLISDLACMTEEGFDIAYLSELDPLWDDDELSFWINPEAVLFANPIAEAACIADCASSSFGCPLSSMFWCQGCRGGVYPLTGFLKNHTAGVDSSTAVVEKMIFKLHRELLLHGSIGKEGLCGLYPMPWWNKSQYKLQMTYPRVPKNSKLACNPIGRTTAIWGMNKEYPIKGEHFGYNVLRRMDCCVL